MLAAAGAVLDHHRLAPSRRKLLADDARQDVGGPAGRKRHDDLDRPNRIVGLCERRHGRGRKPDGCEQKDGLADAVHCSILMPAAAMTWRNFSLSDLISAAVSAGVAPTAAKPASLMRLATSGSFRVSAIACESLSTICVGVFGGATTANQSSCTTSGLISASEGMAGYSAIRLAPVTASSLTLPSRICPSVLPGVSNITSTWPPSRSLSAGVSPG